MRSLLLAAAGWLALLVLVPAAVAAPCSYEERVVDISDSIVSLGEDVGGAIENANDKTDRTLHRQFRRFGQRMRRNERRVAALDPPDALQAQHSQLRAAIFPIRRDLFGIARAAKEHNGNAARTWAVRLIVHSPRLRSARLALVSRAKTRLRDGRCA